MSDRRGGRGAGPLRVALVGATGLIGRSLIEAAIGREDIRITGVARREMPLPPGAKMEMFVAEPDKWSDIFEAVRPQVLVNALGTTWRKSGQDEAAFRSVDQELVLATAKAARAHGTQRMISVSSVGAAQGSKNFYLRVKGEVERDLAKIGFARLDILRPGLLRGPRGEDRRRKERLAIAASPVTDLLLHGQYRRFRSVPARTVAEAALALAMKETRGRYTYDNDALRRLAKGLPKPAEERAK